MKLSYKDILSENNRLKKNFKALDFKIAILSNTITYQLNSILEYELRSRDIPAIVESGNYNNILQDSKKYKDYKVVFIFWELSEFFEGLNYRIENFSEEEIIDVKNKIITQIEFVFEELKESSLVIFNKFSSSIFSSTAISANKFSKLKDDLNIYIINKNYSNFKFVDLDKILIQVGFEKSFNFIQYYLSKVLYTVDFFKFYASETYPFLCSLYGKSKKAIVFDCDNTLWKGILAEDGIENIDMSMNSPYGRIFHEIQSIAVNLCKNGVFVCLCTKNNFEEIENVLINHKDLVLKKEFLAIIKSNWQDKVSNITEISNELNIDLESIVFVDDSDFEINFVKKELNEVVTIQVPKDLQYYPSLIRENLKLFYNLSETNEDKKKIFYIKNQQKREIKKKKFKNIDSYLNSLNMEIKTYRNFKNLSIIERLAQMTQKTNQFNLTTIRYSKNDLYNFINKKDFILLAIEARDMFGDYGIISMCILKYIKLYTEIEIDSFLMSCRIIGRKLEFFFMDYIIDLLVKKNINTIKSKYKKTSKNLIVTDFFDECNFKLVSSNENEKKYFLSVSDYKKINKLNYKIINEQ